MGMGKGYVRVVIMQGQGSGCESARRARGWEGIGLDWLGSGWFG